MKGVYMFVHSRFLLVAFFSTIISFSSYAQNFNQVTVCQSQKCLPASSSVTREFLHKNLSALFEKNVNSSILVCTANPATKMCTKRNLSFPIQNGAISTLISIPSIKIIDSREIPNTTGNNLILDYQLEAGQIFPNCQTSASVFGVSSPDSLQVISTPFACSLTSQNKPVFGFQFNIDYVDFNTSTLGAYVFVGSANSAKPYSQNYVLLKFMNPDHSYLNHPFPLPEVASAQNQPVFSNDTPIQQGVSTGDGSVSKPLPPVWLKPTPILNLEHPQVVSHECSNNPALCSKDYKKNPIPQAHNPNVASTTGLIFQDKNILPPTSGIRKTVTTRKHVIENGKEVSVTEDVRHYTQEDEKAPLQEVSYDLNQLQSTSQQTHDAPQEMNVPKMPQLPFMAQNNAYPTANVQVQYLTPNGVVLSPQEKMYLEQLPIPNQALNIIQGEHPQEVILLNEPQPVNQPQNSSSVKDDFDTIIDNYNETIEVSDKQKTNSQKPDNEKNESFWEKAEKFFYF